MGAGVLVPASYAWGETAVQTLQTFGILLSVTKMVLFALIINAVGAVNSVPQVGGRVECSASVSGGPAWMLQGCSLGKNSHRDASLPPRLTSRPPHRPAPQVLALVLVSLVHLAYLRLCLPFRMRIELLAGGGHWPQPQPPTPSMHPPCCAPARCLRPDAHPAPIHPPVPRSLPCLQKWWRACATWACSFAGSY